MKKILFVLIALTTSVYAQTVTVTGDRVSLRAAPNLTSVLLARAAFDDRLVLMDNSNPDWVGVCPPEGIDLWVHRDFLQDGVVVPAKLNIRSGPSLSHEVVGVVQRGDKLTVRGDLDGWLKIAPPAGTTVWISRKYTDIETEAPVVSPSEPVVVKVEPAVPEPAKEPVILITVESPKPVVAEVVEPVVKTVVQPVINEILIAAVALPDLPETLTPDPDKKQGIAEQFSGILQPANDILCKLVDAKFGSIVICYVRGNQQQMA
ncbi:MAG: SH3 domain-containing protein, partial [Verrucomicrobia bacterium]|nr:SH3 domain-containing protein [Verrucomicrobiota bacterium]